MAMAFWIQELWPSVCRAHDRARQLAAACIRYRGSPAQNKRNTDPSVGRVLDSFTDQADRLLAHRMGVHTYFWDGLFSGIFCGGFWEDILAGPGHAFAYILELLGWCRVSGWIISLVSDGILAG